MDAEAQVPELSPAVLPTPHGVHWQEMEEPGLQPGIPTLDAGMPSSMLPAAPCTPELL